MQTRTVKRRGRRRSRGIAARRRGVEQRREGGFVGVILVNLMDNVVFGGMTSTPFNRQFTWTDQKREISYSSKIFRILPGMHTKYSDAGSTGIIIAS
jgi:hypothetical protein